MITIRQIAKEANVSVATVSRVINKHSYVSDEVASRVQAVIDKYEYVPNSKAVSLSLGRSQTIGVIIPYSSSISYYDMITNGIVSEAFLNDYKVTFLPTDYDPEKEIGYLKLLKAKEFDGIIIVSATNSFHEIAKYAQNGRIVCCEDTREAELGSVYIEREKALLEVLTRLGVRRPENTGITFSRDEKTSIASRKVAAALREFWGDFPASVIYRNARDYQHGYEAGRYYHSLNPHMEVILSNSDEIAAGIIKYYEQQGLEPPLVIGQDNTPVSGIMNFPTIDFHVRDIGRVAVRKVLAGDKGKQCLEYSVIGRGRV